MTERPTILVVDDEPSNIFLMEGILEKEGFQVVSASDGAQALEIIEKNMPDLIISDLLMPRVHGFNLVMEIKNSEKFHHIPVIIATAVYRGQVNKTEARKMGADGFLEKPIDPEVLVETVKKFVTPGEH